MFYTDATRWSPGENLGNIVTHAAASAAGLLLVTQLVSRARAADDDLALFAFAIYGATLVFAFGISAAYHAVAPGRLQQTLLLLDYISIYLLIAGTYTPFVLLAVGGSTGWGLFALFWGLAAVGVVGRVAVREPRQIIGTATYVVIGWSGVVAFGPLRQALPQEGFALLLAGGGVVTFGALIYLWESFPYNHLVWHVLVVVGAAMHASAVWVYL
ncbi:MAG: hemolysin III family protein [Myxococcales bacterium]|nr:hemolysin III family protein [Myxococcales bacterium]